MKKERTKYSFEIWVLKYCVGGILIAGITYALINTTGILAESHAIKLALGIVIGMGAMFSTMALSNILDKSIWPEKCPKCGSSNILYPVSSHIGSSPGNCNDCKHKFY